MYIPEETIKREPTPSERDKIVKYITISVLVLVILGIVLIIYSVYLINYYLFLTGLSEESLREELNVLPGVSKDELHAQVTMFAVQAGICLGLGIAQLVLVFLIHSKVSKAMEGGEYEEAGRHMGYLRVPALVLGFGVGGITLFLAYRTLKESVSRVLPSSIQHVQIDPYAASGEVRTCSVCGTNMNFIAQSNQWYCPACGRYEAAATSQPPSFS